MHAGSILIFCALALSMLHLFFLARSAGGNIFARVTAQRVFYLTSIIIAFAMVLLLLAFLGNDFSLHYVYQHSSLEQPLLYKVSALWAGQEGGFLLWLFFLSIIGIIIIRTKDEHESVLMSLLTITQFFILIALAVKSPFARVWDTNPGQFSGLIPGALDGLGLNPLLQDFWMAVHPPVLFAGYAAAVVPFGYAVAALLRNRYDIMPLRAYRWVIFTATALGIGIFLGGYWAYSVLGWGGYWGWDPVENSSLVPWLLLVALIHGLIIQRRRGSLVRTNLVLAMLSFVLVLYSTFLTRSGILSDFSVHSFSGESVSFQIAYYIAFYIVAGTALLILRGRKIQTEPLEKDVMAPTNLLFYGIVIILLYSAVILLGTSMPILTGLVMKRPSAVNEGFYNTWSIPAGLGILIIISLLTLRRGASFEKLPGALLLAAACAAGVFFNLFHTTTPGAYLLSAAAFLVIGAVTRDWFLRRSKAHRASRLAHLGTAILVLGIVASGYHSFSEQARLVNNVEQNIGNMNIRFLGITEEEKSSLRFSVASGSSSKNVSMLYYFSERTNSIYKEPAILPGITGDTYISPLSYASGPGLASTLVLKTGEAKKIADTEVRFLGMKKVDKKAMMEGKPELFVDLEILMGGASYRVSPGVRMGASGKLESIEAMFSPSKRKVALQHLHRETGEVQLYVEPERGAPLPPDEVIVEIAHKRLMVLVWAATALIALGLAVAMRRVA